MAILFILLPIVLGIVAVLIVIFFVPPRPGKRRRVTGPQCGKCGYSAEGATTMICPECGADFREVGLLVPGARPGIGRTEMVISWTLLVLLIGGVASFALAQFIAPKLWESGKTLRYQSLSRFDCTVRFEIDGQETIWPWQRDRRNAAYPRGTTMAVELRGPNDTVTLIVEPPGETLDITCVDGSHRTMQTPITVEAVDTWMADVGFDLADPEVSDLAAAVFNVVHDYESRVYGRAETIAYAADRPSGRRRGAAVSSIPATSHLYATGSRASSSRPVHPLYSLIAACFWLIIWLIGLRFLLRRRSRRQVES
jgi:hypothetical protein